MIVRIAAACLLLPLALWAGEPAAKPALSVVEAGEGVHHTVTVEVKGQFRVVFEESDNGGLCQWYDLVNDPQATTNLTAPGAAVHNVPGKPTPDSLSSAEPGLFNMVFYGNQVKPGDPKLYIRSAVNRFPKSPRTLVVDQNDPAKVVVRTISNPMLGAGVCTNITATVVYTIHPDGRILLRSTLAVKEPQVAHWNCYLGLQDPTSRGKGAPDTAGWIRSSASQNPYKYVGKKEPYLFAYWSPQTPEPESKWSKASIMLVPRKDNPARSGQFFHGWTDWKRWGYSTPLDLPANGSITQHFLIQLGTQGSSVLPDLRSNTVADPIAEAYQQAPIEPDTPEPQAASRR